MVLTSRARAVSLVGTGFASIFLSACGQAPEDRVMEQSGPADGAPAISPAAAPGVAFRYRYAFVLPDRAISSMQEQHASACEKLGVARCRIVGMSYRLLDEGRVEGSLEFKLAPYFAREFGKQGIASVEKASGKLVDATISGDDAGGRIAGSQINSENISNEIERIEREQSASKPGTEEAAELRRRAEELRTRLLQEKQARQADAEILSNTPMTFIYTGDKGFTLGRNPISDALHAVWSSVEVILTVVLVGVGYALPWLLLAGVILALWRSRPVLWLRDWVTRSKDTIGED